MSEIKLYALKESMSDFENGLRDTIVLNRVMWSGLDYMEVKMSKVLDAQELYEEGLKEQDLYESSLDEVESARRLTVLPAIEELEMLLLNENSIDRKKGLITLIDNLLWTEAQINKLKKGEI